MKKAKSRGKFASGSSPDPMAKYTSFVSINGPLKSPKSIRVSRFGRAFTKHVGGLSR
jgi:hypothetical protein